MPSTLRGWHGLSALVVGIFLLVHMGNHVIGLAGQNFHIGYMTWARAFYRNPFVETCLLSLLAWQLGSGMTMVVRSWGSRRGGVAWLQALSGLYLALFLCVHVGAVLLGRAVLGLDTDFRFAAAGFHVPPWHFFFAPYYFLAVASLFAHVGCAVYWAFETNWPKLGRPALAMIGSIGLIAGALFDLSLAGELFPVDIPTSYRATYSSEPH
jgi:hypothetical protein